MIERPAVPVGRKDLAFLERVAAPMRELDRHPAGQRHVALAGDQALAGIVHRDERRRAGGLHIDARAAQVEREGGSRRQKILVVARVAQQEHSHLVDQVAIAADVEIEIAAHAAAGENTDRSGLIVRRPAGVLHGFPGAFQEMAVLGIHDRRFLRVQAEELRVEHFHIGKIGAAGNIVGVMEPLGVLAFSDQVLGRKRPDRLYAVSQVLPEFRNITRTRHSQSHADDCNIAGTDLV
jgi:hypothetical protein